MTTSLPDALLGAQQPRLRSVPTSVGTAGQDYVDLAALAGLHLDPWQQLVLHDALGERPDGLWSAFEVALVVPRQNGKGSVLEALELGALFLYDGQGPPPLVLHSAHEFKTSAEHFLRMRTLIDGCDALRSKVRIVRTATGSESIELHSGARVKFVTRTSGSGRGFSADLVVIDEAYNLSPEVIAAVLPTLSARPNPQVWYTSSAGMASSVQLERIRKRALDGGSARLAYLEWSAPDGADLDDEQAWAQANPALGRRIPVDLVRAERATLQDEEFGRERMGLWADTVREPALDLARWAQAADPGSQLVGTPAFALEASSDRQWWTVAVAGKRADGRRHLEVSQVFRGHRDVAPWLLERLRSYGARLVVDAAGPAASLLPDLEVDGTVVDRVGRRDLALACGRLVDLLEADDVRHLGQPVLDRAAQAARRRSTGELWLWDRRDKGPDCSPLLAVTLALHGSDLEPPDYDVLASVF